MKTKYALAMLFMGMSAAAIAQENDDMYFNSKDRLQVNKANQIILAKKYQQEDLNAVRTNPVNPSDSYSGRGINPEYIAQPKNGTSMVQNNPDYFLSGYQPKNLNSNLYGGSNSYANCNCGYGYSGYGSPYSRFYSPYSSFYSPYSSFYSPYGGFYPGLTTSIGFGSFGSGWYSGIGYGMGGMYGMYGSPYYGAGYSPYGYGNGYGSYYGYPTTVVVTGADYGGRSYGNHPSRSSTLNNNYVDRARSNGYAVGADGRANQGGRVSSSSPNYYDRGWRSNADNFTQRSSYYNSNSSGSWGNSNNNSRGWNSSTWDSDGRRPSSSFDSFGSGGSRGFGGGGFSGGGVSGGGGGSGSHSRGRN